MNTNDIWITFDRETSHASRGMERVCHCCGTHGRGFDFHVGATPEQVLCEDCIVTLEEEEKTKNDSD